MSTFLLYLYFIGLGLLGFSFFYQRFNKLLDDGSLDLCDNEINIFDDEEIRTREMRKDFKEAIIEEVDDG